MVFIDRYLCLVTPPTLNAKGKHEKSHQDSSYPLFLHIIPHTITLHTYSTIFFHIVSGLRRSVFKGAKGHNKKDQCLGFTYFCSGVLLLVLCGNCQQVSHPRHVQAVS